MRLFMGIELPEKIKMKLEQQLLPLQDSPKGWVMPHDYHLTLLFIGSEEVESVTEVLKRLREMTFTPFEIELTGIHFFGRRIMYVKCQESFELIELKKNVESKFLRKRIQ
jgi:2'-5' RNA ligase